MRIVRDSDVYDKTRSVRTIANAPERLEDLSTLWVALVGRSRHPGWVRALARPAGAASAAAGVGGYLVDLAKHVADRTQLHLNLLGRLTAKLQGTLRTDPAEQGRTARQEEPTTEICTAHHWPPLRTSRAPTPARSQCARFRGSLRGRQRERGGAEPCRGLTCRLDAHTPSGSCFVVSNLPLLFAFFCDHRRPKEPPLRGRRRAGSFRPHSAGNASR